MADDVVTPDDWSEPEMAPLHVLARRHDHKGHSEEMCVRCGWVMGHRPLNCMNDDTPHVFPSQQAEIERLRSVIAAFVDAECSVSDLQSVVDSHDLNERRERVAAARSALEDVVIGERIRERATTDNGRRTSLREVAAEFGIDIVERLAREHDFKVLIFSDGHQGITLMFESERRQEAAAEIKLLRAALRLAAADALVEIADPCNTSVDDVVEDYREEARRG